MGQPAFLPPPQISGNKYKVKMNNSLEKKDALVKQLEDMGEQLQGLGYPDQALAGNEKLQKLARAYNLVVEEIRTLEEKPRFDPIERLPKGALVTILKQAVVRDSHGALFISTDMVLLLTLVSSKWRCFIESTPSLWSDIVLDHQIKDLAMKVKISLHFSHEACLAVQIVGRLRCEDIVLPHAARIRSIYLVGERDYHGTFPYTVQQLLTPQLRFIYFSHYDCGLYYWCGMGNNGHTDDSLEMEQKIFHSGRIEYLHRVTGFPLSRAVFKLPFIRNLKEFSTNEDAVCVLAETLPRIETAEFLGGVYGVSTGVSLTMETLRWTSLTYRQGVMETLTSLLRRSPSLRDLSIIIEYDDLSHLMSSMQNLKALHSLDLTLRGTQNETFTPPVMMEPLDQVRAFIFREGSGFFSEADWEKESQIPNAFFCLIPNVEFLEIESCMSPMVYKLTSAVGFRKVHTLLLHLTGTARLGDIRISESVRRLKVKFDSPNVSIAPGVERLQMVRLDLHNAGSQYSTVQSLYFTHFEGPSNDFQSFTTLTGVRIGGDEAVTRFCAIIATFPNTCPALHTLSFERFPDLDILFIMLERRNLYSHSKRVQIRNLELPTRMSLSNFITVRDLLRGRIVERQSNFKASLQSNVDTFFNPKKSGCIACHKAQVFCSAPTNTYWGERIVSVSSIPLYPTTVEDIINTWQARSFTGSNIYRARLSCCDDKFLTQITGDSLEWPLY